MSKLITVDAGGTTATVEDAKIGDIFTTLISSDKAVTGTYGLVQRAGLFLGGMSVQTKRLRGTFNPFVSA